MCCGASYISLSPVWTCLISLARSIMETYCLLFFILLFTKNTRGWLFLKILYHQIQMIDLNMDFFLMKSIILKLKILSSCKIHRETKTLNTHKSLEGNCGSFSFSVTCCAPAGVTRTPQNDIMPTLLSNSEQFLEEGTHLLNKNRTKSVVLRVGRQLTAATQRLRLHRHLWFKWQSQLCLHFSSRTLAKKL